MVFRLLSKFMYVVPTILGVTIIAFGLVHLIPGDPVEAIFGDKKLTPEVHERLLKSMGLDQPLIIQYLVYLKHLLSFDLGRSIVSGQAVLSEFFSRFPASVELAIGATIVSSVIGISIGIVAAVNRGKFWDYFLMGIALIGYSMPIFWWGLLCIIFFSVELGILPVSGYIGSSYWIEPVTGFSLIDTLISGDMDAFGSAVSHLILPSFVLGTLPAAAIARMTRSSMLEVLNEDYITVAKSKGISSFRVIIYHAFRNALLPVITIIGMQLGYLFGGAVLTETIFGWPGVGKWMIEALNRRDYPIVQGGMLIISIFIIFTNMFVDIVYTVINPRMRG